MPSSICSSSITKRRVVGCLGVQENTRSPAPQLDNHPRHFHHRNRDHRTRAYQRPISLGDQHDGQVQLAVICGQQLQYRGGGFAGSARWWLRRRAAPWGWSDRRAAMRHAASGRRDNAAWLLCWRARSANAHQATRLTRVFDFGLGAQLAGQLQGAKATFRPRLTTAD